MQNLTKGARKTSDFFFQGPTNVLENICVRKSARLFKKLEKYVGYKKYSTLALLFHW